MENFIDIEVREAEKKAEKLFNTRKEYVFLILGILLGIFGNVIATGMWDFKTRVFNWTAERGFFIVDGDSALLYGVSLIIFFGVLYILFHEFRAIDLKFKGQDNIVRAYHKAPEVWDAKGKLVPISWDKPRTAEGIKEKQQ